MATDAKAELDLEDWRWLRDKRELRLGIGNDLPPFDITTSGRDFEGLTADVAGVIADKLGIDIKVLRYPSREEALRALEEGRVDLLSASNSFETNNRQLLLSDTYAPDQPVLVSRDDERRPLSPGLVGMHLVMSADYQPVERIRAHYPLARVSTAVDPAPPCARWPWAAPISTSATWWWRTTCSTRARPAPAARRLQQDAQRRVRLRHAR